MMSATASGVAEAGKEPQVSEADRTTGLAEAGNARMYPKQEDRLDTVLFLRSTTSALTFDLSRDRRLAGGRRLEGRVRRLPESDEMQSQLLLPKPMGTKP